MAESTDQPTAPVNRVHRETFGETVRLYAAPLFRYCCRRVHDRQLAEDAVQETFLRAYRVDSDATEIRGPGWLFAVARNCCQELLRKELRHAGDARRWAAMRPSPQAGGPAHDRLEQAVERLDDDERALVYLKHVEGRRCAEIAETLGQPIGTVTGTLSRAYRKLRESMTALQE